MTTKACPGCSGEIDFDDQLNVDDLCDMCSIFIEAVRELNEQLKEEDDVHV